MGAANNNLNPEWQPAPFPGEYATLWTWRKLSTQYIYELRSQQANLNQTVQNFNNNVTNQVSQTINEFFNNNGGNGIIKPPVISGPHVLRLATPPGNANGYIFVETDRFQAEYYSNGLQWVAGAGVGVGSFESRWSGLNSFDAGLNWIETSRNNTAGLPPYPNYRWDGANWNFLNGEFYRTQANLANLANTFAPANAANGNDVGVRVNVTDFHHQLQWTATTANNVTTFGWNWSPEDDLRAGEGPIFREVDPSPTTGWQLYAGNNNVTYLKSDGTTGNVNLPNLVSANNVAFVEAGNVNSNINPAVVPIFTGNAASGSVSQPTFTGDVQNFNTANFTSLLAGNAALVSPTSITPTGNVSQPTFTGNNVTGVISNNGQPPSITRRPWFRR